MRRLFCRFSSAVGYGGMPAGFRPLIWGTGARYGARAARARGLSATGGGGAAVDAFALFIAYIWISKRRNSSATHNTRNLCATYGRRN